MLGKKGYMGIKLNISKEYDIVEWDYLKSITQKMGFAEPWIRLIMECVRMVTYSVLINEKEKKEKRKEKKKGLGTSYCTWGYSSEKL